MTYTPPQGNLISIDFDGVDYIAPQGNLVALDFSIAPVVSADTQYFFPNPIDNLKVGSPILSIGQFLNPLGFDELNIGTAYAWRFNQHINTSGINSNIFGLGKIENLSKELKPTGTQSKAAFGTTKIYNLTTIVKPIAWQSLNIGTGASIVNKNKILSPHSWVSSSDGKPLVYNLTQYQRLNGFNTSRYGVPYLMGGVKYINLNNRSISAAQYGLATIVNTKADRYVILTNKGIAPPVMPSPNVSPRFIRPTTLKSDVFGNPTTFLKTRLVLVVGVNNAKFGNGWVSHSPRYLEPNYIDAFNSGFPKVFDPTQKIYVTGANTVITGGVFGDISAKNTKRIITVSGLYSQSFSDWSIVESSLRNIIHSGFDAQSFGSNTIRNKTPSIAPIGINSFAGLNSAIGYRIRTIKPSGFYQPKFGQPTLTKTPELKPSGNNQNIFGATWVSHKHRFLNAGLGRESLIFGEISVWHYTRHLKVSGIINDSYGIPRIEHGRRVLLAKGSIHSIYGNNTWLSYAVRFIAPLAIDYHKIPNHRVGGTQNIQPFGYVATLFGSRIIPESQSIYPQGFINAFGITIVDLWKKYIKPNGFLTTGQEGGHRFGTHKFWNLRQYIVQFYDGDSGLVPPKWTGWTSIENRNKTIGAIGSNFAHIGEPNIENKARLLSANGLNTLAFGQAMIADRIRKLKLQSIESPYMSSWSVIYNAAPVIAQKGFKADAFGIGTILNTRRYFNRIGNFESLEMGKPMIADRIRTLKFEQRYTIAPPYIPIHSVHLYTRYIEEVGRFDDHQRFGNPSLSVHWNIITPRWTMRDAYGTPIIKNLTPELGTRGRNSEEFGQASIRTQWRELLHLGSETVVWGRSEVAFRDRQFSVSGFTQWVIPKHTVIKTGVPPYYPQYIWLDAVELDGEQNNGHGIKIPERQVSDPSVKSNVIFPDSFIASRYGSHHAQSNGILLESGIQEFSIGNHFVGLKNRTIQVPTLGDLLEIEETRPRVSPHTIYAVMEAPAQAIKNHPSSRLHFVNSDGGNRQPGEVFGWVTVTNRHRTIRPSGSALNLAVSEPRVQLRKRYIKPQPFNSFRMGWHYCSDGSPQHIEQYDSENMQAFGRSSIVALYYGPQNIRAGGLNANLFGVNRIEHFHRIVRAVGSNMLLMGAGRSGDTPYKPQGLWVGEPKPTIPKGFNAEVFGDTRISLRVRDVTAVGFDSFISEMDISNFKGRMKVTLVKKPVVIEPKEIKAEAFGITAYGVPNIRLKTHYIRPDGNSDQYRKGAPK